MDILWAHTGAIGCIVLNPAVLTCKVSIHVFVLVRLFVCQCGIELNTCTEITYLL